MIVRDHRVWPLWVRAAVAAVAMAGAVSAARAADPPPQAPTPGVALPAEAPPPAPADVKPADPATRPQAPAAGQEQVPDDRQRMEAARREETFEVARQLAKDFPTDSNAIGLMGTVCNAYNQTAEAIVWWQKCVEVDPRRADAYFGLATIAQKKSEYRKAEEFWRKAQEIEPNLPGMYGRYAETLLNLGKPEEAMAAVMKEIRFTPDDMTNYLRLGQAHLQLKEYDKAVAAYEKARGLSPGHSKPYYGLAAAWARLGQADKAKEYSEQFRKIRAEEDKVAVAGRNVADDVAWVTKNLVQVRMDAGELNFTYGRPEKAEEHWRRAAALDPKHTACRRALIDLYVRAGRARQALTFSEQLRAIDPRNAAYHLGAAVLLVQLERFDAAEEAARKAIDLEPNDPKGYLFLVRLLVFRKQNPAEALALARKLVEMKPAAEHYGLLGDACRLSGDLAGARAALERAMQLDPGNAQIRAAYAQLKERE